MPRRGNPFQSLVRSLHEQAPSDAHVTESSLLQDRVTGQAREVDVVIELEVHGHHLVVSIECVDRRRPAGVPWVDEMIQKHADLPTDKLVLVSASGFAGTAIRKAESKGVETVVLEELSGQPWTRIVGRGEQLLIESIRAHVGIAVLRTPEDEWPGWPLSLNDQLVRGDLSVSVQRLVDAVLSKKELMEVALRVAGEAEGNGSSIIFDPSPGMIVKPFEGEAYEVHNLIAVVLPTVSHDAVQLKSGMIGKAAVAYGGIQDPEGRELDIAVIEFAEREPQFTFSERQQGKEASSRSLSEELISGLDPAAGWEVRRLLGRDQGS